MRLFFYAGRGGYSFSKSFNTCPACSDAFTSGYTFFIMPSFPMRKVTRFAYPNASGTPYLRQIDFSSSTINGKLR